MTPAPAGGPRRHTRSIVLVLIGAGFAAAGGCDDRQRHAAPPADNDPAEPPTTGPAAFDADGNRVVPYGHGSTFAPGRNGSNPIVGPFIPFASRRSTTIFPPSSGSRSASSGSRTATPSRSTSSSGSHGTTFGGFGSHASSSSAGG